VGRDGDKQRERPQTILTFSRMTFSFPCTRAKVTSVDPHTVFVAREHLFHRRRGGGGERGKPTFIHSSSYKRHHPLFRHTDAHSLGDDGLASSSRCCHGDAAVAAASSSKARYRQPMNSGGGGGGVTLRSAAGESEGCVPTSWRRWRW